MGIPNFSSFVSSRDLRKSFQLSDCYVVIDGNNLLYYLYIQYSKLNSNDFLFGGNYTELRHFFRKFFQSLKKCKITAIIVFDGGLDLKLKDSRMSRFEKSMKISQNLNDVLKSNSSPESQSSAINGDIIFPALMQNVFISVIKESSNVFCLRTVLDADLNIAKLANYLKCPVISNDSDFLIMSVNGGVISCDSFEWQSPHPAIGVTKQSKDYFIECKLYKVFDFAEKFRLKPEMLPIFGSLMGNDAIDDKVFDELFSDILLDMRFKSLDVNHVSQIDQRLNKRYLRMNQLLYWLSHRFSSTKQAIDYIEKYLTDKRIDTKDFRASIIGYKTDENCFLNEMINHLLAKTKEENIPIETIVEEKRFPKWFLIEYFYKIDLDSDLFTFIDGKLLMKRPLVEDFFLNSCYDSSHELYAFLLGLLRLKRNDKKPIRLITRSRQCSRIKAAKTIEMDIYPKTRIIGSSSGYQVLPVLGELRQFTDNQRKRLLFDILKLNDKCLTHLEGNLIRIKNPEIDKQDIDFWKYFVVVIKYWKSKSKITKYNFDFIGAMVLSVIYYRHNSLIKNDFKGLTTVSSKPFKLIVTHSYCEFQTIYSTINAINSLMGYPITDAKIHHYLNGILYTNIFEEITAKRIKTFEEKRLNTITHYILESIYEE